MTKTVRLWEKFSPNIPPTRNVLIVTSEVRPTSTWPSGVLSAPSAAAYCEVTSWPSRLSIWYISMLQELLLLTGLRVFLCPPFPTTKLRWWDLKVGGKEKNCFRFFFSLLIISITSGNAWCAAVCCGSYNKANNPIDFRDDEKIKEFIISKYEKKRYYVDPSHANFSSIKTQLTGGSTGSGDSHGSYKLSSSSLIGQPRPNCSYLTNLTLPCRLHPEGEGGPL